MVFAMSGSDHLDFVSGTMKANDSRL
jgi:hypothetical protein